MKPRVAVIMGGKSAEREISLKTGNQICQALRSKSYEVISFDLDDALYSNLRQAKPDVVYIALHGKYGEDGCLQGMLEIMGIPYVGSGVLASALAMDKGMSKKIFAAAGIPTPDGILLTRREILEGTWKARVDEFAMDHGFPLVVKPNSQGSTIGLSIVKDLPSIKPGIDKALEFDDCVIVEEYIDGTELTVGIIGNQNPVVLPVMEIVSETGLYDYTAKYTKGMSHHIIPARIPAGAREKAGEVALAAHNALGCRGLSRVDIMLSAKRMVPYVLEVNTLPGMTETSLVPDAARAVGIEFPDLVERLVLLALER
ncbi:MAG TPA: D-alanine--D-alanine ligase [Firmicutes bacterium]|nr:D-alanine--D-alanine ligase [Bacillota bacterium]